MQVHIERNGQQFGPYTLDEVHSHLSSGAILPTDNAWAEGQPGWVPTSQFPGITLPGAAPRPSPPHVSPKHSAIPPAGHGKNKAVLAGIIVGAVTLLALIVLAVLMATGKLDSEEEIKEDLTQYVNNWETIIIPCHDITKQLKYEMLVAKITPMSLGNVEDLVQNAKACNKKLADLNPETVTVRKLHWEIIETQHLLDKMTAKLLDSIKDGSEEISEGETMELMQTMKEGFDRALSWRKDLFNISSKHGVPLDKEKWNILDL